MCGVILRYSFFIIALAMAFMPESLAGQRTARRFSKQQAERKTYTLDDVMKAPREYLEREILFYSRFATTSNLFKNVNTRFNSTSHVNFAVWPDKAILWEEKGRKNVLPTMYVAKNDPDTLEMLRTVSKYELLAVTGEVLNVYAGYPWILVTKIERVEKPSERLCEQVIEHMQSGHEALRAEAGGAAARHYEQALTMGLPCEFRAKAYEQLAHAYLLDNQLDSARDYLRQAVELDRNDPVLHLALADVTLKMGDPGEAIAHAQFALERSGRYPQAYGLMGEALSALGDHAKAFANLNTAAGTPGITPREKAMVNVRRARIYARSGREPDAARMYVSVSEPGEPLSGDASIHNEIGLFYERLYLLTDEARYLDSAFAAFEEAARLGRVNPALYYNAAEVEFRRQRLDERDFSKVLQLIEKIYQIEPDYAAARVLEGRVLYAQDNTREAEFRYQSVSGRIGEDSMALLALAEAYIDLGRFDDAARAVKRARTLQPWNERVQAIGEFIIDDRVLAESDDAGLELDEDSVEVASAEFPVAFPERDEPPAAKRIYMKDEEERTFPPLTMRTIRADEPAADAGDDEWTVIGEDLDSLWKMDTPSISWDDVKAPEVPKNPFANEQSAKMPEVKFEVTEGRRLGPNEFGDWMDYDKYLQTGAGAERALTARPLAPQPSPSSPLSLPLPGTGTLAPPGVNGSVPAKAPVELRLSPLPPKPEQLTEAPGGLRPPVANATVTLRPEESVEEIQAVAPPGITRTTGHSNLPMTRVTLPPSLESLRHEYDSIGEPARQPDKSVDFFTLERIPETQSVMTSGTEKEPLPWMIPPPPPPAGFGLGSDEYLRPRPVASFNAFPMLPPPDYDENAMDRTTEGEVSRIPPAFSFDSDDSPVILASVMSPGSDNRDIPQRNANVYRRHGGKRRPAEITEHEPISPRLVLDAAAMAGPAGGAVPRTEVRLPASSRGVGSDVGYGSGR